MCEIWKRIRTWIHIKIESWIRIQTRIVINMMPVNNRAPRHNLKKIIESQQKLGSGFPVAFRNSLQFVIQVLNARHHILRFSYRLRIFPIDNRESCLFDYLYIPDL
jgi:hypothetical protein